MALAPQQLLDDRRLADTLAAEIRRYLAAVDAFRAAGFPPRWRTDGETAA